MKSNEYEKINNAFEKAVTKLQDGLQYLADNDKVSDSFISMQNLIIKSLIDYQHQTECYISTLEMENLQLANGRINEIEKLKTIKESLEAICIIHGIMDLNVWINRSNKHLVNEAVYHYKEGIIQIPYKLLEWISKLPNQDKQTIERILYKTS